MEALVHYETERDQQLFKERIAENCSHLEEKMGIYIYLVCRIPSGISIR